MDIDEITKIAAALRMAFEAAGEIPTDPVFESFPMGTCGPTAELVGRYLLEACEMDTLAYVSKSNLEIDCPEYAESRFSKTDVNATSLGNPGTHTMIYFAYGSNLDPVQWAQRCPGSPHVAVARLDGYRLHFPRHSPVRRCAVASIAPAAGDVVWGRCTG